MKLSHIIETQIEMELEDIKEMNGKKCLECKKGTYGERNIHNDWDGTVTCDKCGDTVTDRQKSPTKPK